MIILFKVSLKAMNRNNYDAFEYCINHLIKIFKVFRTGTPKYRNQYTKKMNYIYLERQVM